MPWELLSADAITNTENPTHDTIVALAQAALQTGAPGLMRYVDARGNLTIARPNWEGQVVWWINPGDPIPTNLIDGDAVQEVDTEPLPWTPTYLPNKVAWWDAQLLGLTEAAAVASWPDLSGNGNTLTQATSGSQPVMDVDKINGHPAVVADGTNDRLTATITSPFSNPCTVYVVGGTDLADNASASDFMVSGYGTSSPSLAAIFRNTSEQYGISHSSSATAAGSWTVGPKLFKAVYNGASSTLDVNGVNVVTGTTSSAPGNILEYNLFSRGDGANFYPGYIGEVLIVQGLVSTENNALVLEYLNDHWSLGLTL